MLHSVVVVVFFSIFCFIHASPSYYLVYSYNSGEGLFSSLMIMYRMLMFSERLRSLVNQNGVQRVFF